MSFKPFYRIYITQGQGECKAAEVETEQQANDYINAAIARREGSFRFVRVEPNAPT